MSGIERSLGESDLQDNNRVRDIIFFLFFF
uniref:Uncharacterized protein n=1 Tax=Heterorhabditis bacteriophora TaxID=37862 RepID=A0A1I7XRW8_HETBA